MNSVKKAVLCGVLNIKKWRVEPRMLIIALMLLVFALYSYSNLVKVAADYNMKIPLSIAVSYFMPTYMQTIFGLLVGLMFCSAPFYEEHSPFLVVRTGRVNWALGQIFYIFISAFLFSVCVFVASWLAILPKITLSGEWGTIIRTLSDNPSALGSYDIKAYFIAGIDRFSPLSANLQSFFMVWLTVVFVGMLFMFLSSVLSRVATFSIYGALLFLSLSSAMFGVIKHGYIIRYIAPLSFCNIFMFREYNENPNYPTLGYAAVFLAVSVFLMGAAIVMIYRKKDLIVENEIL